MIDVKTQGGATRVFLNRQEKANALDSRLLSALLEAFSSPASDSGLRFAVLAIRRLPEVRLGIPSVVEAALLARLIAVERSLRAHEALKLAL